MNYEDIGTANKIFGCFVTGIIVLVVAELLMQIYQRDKMKCNNYGKCPFWDFGCKEHDTSKPSCCFHGGLNK